MIKGIIFVFICFTVFSVILSFKIANLINEVSIPAQKILRKEISNMNKFLNDVNVITSGINGISNHINVLGSYINGITGNINGITSNINSISGINQYFRKIKNTKMKSKHNH